MGYPPIKFVFFLKSRLLFNVFYCLCMFVSKYFTYLQCTYVKEWRVLQCAIFMLVFLYEGKCIANYSHLHKFTFKYSNLLHRTKQIYAKNQHQVKKLATSILRKIAFSDASQLLEYLVSCYLLVKTSWA